jgi:hypothetical protein
MPSFGGKPSAPRFTVFKKSLGKYEQNYFTRPNSFPLPIPAA